MSDAIGRRLWIFLDAETAPGQISFSKRPSSKTYRKGKRSIMNEKIQCNLPRHFSPMQGMLGSEYSDFLASFDAPWYYATISRVNTSKITCRDFEKLAPFSIRRSIPWIKNGYFYDEDVRRPGPYYQAGLYYLQEPAP
ncbi:MAG: hypothetical protein ACLUTA_07450 [Blautia wexlerae]